MKKENKFIYLVITYKVDWSSECINEYINVFESYNSTLEYYQKKKQECLHLMEEEFGEEDLKISETKPLMTEKDFSYYIGTNKSDTYYSIELKRVMIGD